ncbi:hypothetical protein HF521_007530 [Silurus meridionalis]|uniref:Sema domain-containing protein n=1 Tax=Silurus meridionalis TaxID=175797 RepID=A0A8T0AP14_SILME|nr:hypothetical protein HF521_007530 [Silurus meridionalis]
MKKEVEERVDEEMKEEVEEKLDEEMEKEVEEMVDEEMEEEEDHQPKVVLGEEIEKKKYSWKRSEVMGRSLGLEVPLLLLLFISFVSSVSPPLPRIFLSFQELQASHWLEFYTLSEKQMDYRLLYVDEDQDRMYVGCKDHLLSMDINNISQGTLKIHWPASNSKIEECQMAGKDPTHGCGNFLRVIQPYNRTHLFICGSGAYSPVCAYVNRGRRPEEKVFHVSSKSESGKGRCSFNPRVNTVSVMLNQELFSGVYIDFMGTDAAIFRSLTNRNAVRTDQHNSKWLSEPVFIGAHLIPDGSDPNDSKLYFFFRERLTDNNGNTRSIHSMVARVCPNDVGGQRSLVNKWATFLKARMVCSVVEADGTETHFDELESVFLLETEHPKGLLIYGLFTSTSSVFKGSAVCVYNMADVLTVFNGPFAHRDGPNFQWTAYQGRMPYPRPGTCPGGAFTPHVGSSKEFSDDVVTFMRNHPLMFHSVYPPLRRPLLLRTHTDYRYTAIAVDQVHAADGLYHVLFLGTDRGTVQKVVVLPTNRSLDEDLILEEFELFKKPAAITSLRISSKKQQLYVSSVRRIPGVPAPLSCLRFSMCRLLFSARPVLRLGWAELLSFLQYRKEEEQEAGHHAWESTHTVQRLQPKSLQERSGDVSLWSEE